MAVAEIASSISIATRRSTATGSKRSPRRCTALSAGVDRHVRRALGGSGQQEKSSNWRGARTSPTTTTSAVERKGYIGIGIPRGEVSTEFRGGMLEMDEPEHREYRTPLNAYLSPAAVQRWVPVVDEIVKACLDEKIEDRPDRLRRRPRQHRARGAHARPAGRAAEGLGDLLRARPRDGVHPRRLAGLSPRRRPAHRVGNGDDAPRRRDPGDAEARADRRPGPDVGSTASRRRTPRSWAC